MHTDAVPDYERPFNVKPWERSMAAELFRGRCERGDKRSCIVEAELRPLDEAGTAFRTVEANCLAGDNMSCRALPPDELGPRFPKAPGAMSRRRRCQGVYSPTPCDPVVLRDECLAGFAVGCLELMFTPPHPADYDALFDSWTPKSRIGCAAGVETECELAVTDPDNNDVKATAQLLCDLRRERCDRLAGLYRELKDYPNERDTLEIACEYGKNAWTSCIELGAGYLQHHFEEPVAGRGQALIDWACPGLAGWAGPDEVARRPICRRAKKPD
jgi:hypothetical protein